MAKPIPAGHPSSTQIIECFSRLVGTVVAGPGEAYPGEPVADTANTNTPNFTCREMGSSHTGLKIGSKTFDTFVGVLAADLMPLVAKDGEALVAGKISMAEFGVVAKALTDTKTPIVDTTAPSADMALSSSPATAEPDSGSCGLCRVLVM